MKTRSLLPLWILAILSLALAVGCELDEDENKNTADTFGGNGSMSATVTFLNGEASPSTVDLATGGTVTFQNNDGSDTHFISFTGGSLPDTGDINPGSSTSVTFSSPGNYNFGCDYHTNACPGECGVIQVQ